MTDLRNDWDEPQLPRGGGTDSHDSLLLAVARFAKSEGVTVIVIVPRGPGVVNRARDLARCTGLQSAAEITVDHISVWLSPN